MEGHGVKLDTLKECLMFLEWLHSDKQGIIMKGLIASRLARLLEKRYKNVSQPPIESALSQFLTNVNKFHTTLCKSAKQSTNNPNTTKNVLNTLLDCIPKFLAVMYFLRYQVDDKFSALGGGGWANDSVGLISRFAALGERAAALTGPVDKYLTAESGTDYGGVIPGGFDPGDLKPGYQSGYSPASAMVKDIQSILNKQDKVQNYFLDVYSTTVLPTSGAETPNIANSLRLVQDFCRIFGNVKNEEDFKMHLYSKDKCIQWKELQEHCKQLQDQFGKIFKKEAFSFTGYAREYDKLKQQDIAKKMASWLKMNLGKVKEKLEKIEAFSDVSNLRQLRKGIKSPSSSQSTALQNYFTKQFIPYGFTFYANKYDTRSAPYDLLQRQWDTAIRELKSSDGGLQRLVEILNGQQCQAQEEQRKQRRNERQDDDQPEEIDEEALEEPADEELLDSGKTVTHPKPGAARPVLTKAEVAKPTASKSDSTANQGKKAEGAQNQGKKSEGAQNQGKKVEGAQNQGKKSEGAQNQGEKSEGAQNQGKKVEGAQNQGKDQGGGTLQVSPVTGSAPDPPSVDQGVTGPAGPTGVQHPQGPSGTVDLGYSSTPASQPQNIAVSQQTSPQDPPEPPPPVPPPPAAPPSAPAGPDIPAKPGPPGQGSSEDGSPGSQPAATPSPTLTQPPSVTSSGSGTTGGQGSGRGGGGAVDTDVLKRQQEKRDKDNANMKIIEEQFKKNFENIGQAIQRQTKNNMQKQLRLNTGAYDPPIKQIPALGLGARPGATRPYYVPGDGQPRQVRAYNLFADGHEISDPFFETQRQKERDKALELNQNLVASKLREQHNQGLREVHDQWDKSLVDTKKVEEAERKKQMKARTQNITERLKAQEEQRQRAAQKKTAWLLDPSRIQEAERLKQAEEAYRKKEEEEQRKMKEERDRRRQQMYDQYESELRQIQQEQLLSIDGSQIPTPKPGRSVVIDAVRGQVLQDGSDPVYQKQQEQSKFISYMHNDYSILTGHNAVGSQGQPGKTPVQSFRFTGVPDGQPIGETHPLSKSTLPQKIFGSPVPTEPKGIDLTKQHGATKPPPVITYNDIAPLTGQVKVPPTHTLPDVSGTPIKDPPRPIPSVNILPDLGVLNPLVSEAKGQPISDPNVGRRMPPLPNSKAAQLSHNRNKPPATMMLDYHDVADISHVTGEVIETEPNQFPTAEVTDYQKMEMSVASQLQGNPVSTSLQSAQQHSQKVREANELWEHFKEEQNKRREEEAKKIESEREKEKESAENIFKQKKESGQKLHYADAVKNKNKLIKNLRGGEVYISGPPSPKTEKEEIDLRIDVPKPIFQDPVHDFDFYEDSTHIQDDAQANTVAPYKSAVSLNVLPPDPQQYLPPREDPTFTRVEFVDKCPVPWLTQKPTYDSTDIPETELFPSEAPRTVREMLVWMAGLQHKKHQETLQKCITNAFKRDDGDPSDLTLPVNGADIRPQHVIDTIKLVSLFAASVLTAVAPEWRMAVPSATSTSKDADCCALLCHLRDYAYACYHQLAFLKSQCSQVTEQGGWQDCAYGHGVSAESPLQAFLTDISDFETHFFDPCNLWLKSRVRMGFGENDLPRSHETGKCISIIFTSSCGGNDPLPTLCSYLNCLTRRTPRTTGELVSFFHNFGNELHDVSLKLSPLGSALSEPHRHCPDWDHLAADDLNAIQYIRGPAPPTSNHDKDHPKTLSAIIGCGIDNVDCPQHLFPITYQAYALYSPSFAHTYLSWAVYLANRLWESLVKLHCDLEKLQSHRQAVGSGRRTAYRKPHDRHGRVPPQNPCPFLFTLVALWLIATLYILVILFYRLDVLRIRSHLLTTKASHNIDVKALLAGSRRMLSLYKDVDYFDDDFHS
ncbi:Ribosome-binding protein 1, putative [Babesia ovata]|uniref:Ribosome-binding protein 1, putative n=1 Tax=Babesia ovata TaxID=189622 RepID=A0A2H6KG72_9APIC|nr:Ribosome-binding protein 1, putative [Babesia ovata]GBE61977.1 Ribosome-binding protein 1, putative [Babesia ovata]